MSCPHWEWLRREDLHLHERIQSPWSCWLDDTAINCQGDRTCTCMISVPSGVADYLAPHPGKLAAGGVSTKMAPAEGFAPSSSQLTAGRSAVGLHRNKMVGTVRIALT